MLTSDVYLVINGMKTYSCKLLWIFTINRKSAFTFECGRHL